jgi:hypothetical protein
MISNGTMTKRDRVMQGAAIWCAFYRHNPHRFCKDYLHLDLRLFQKIMIVMMNISTTVVFIGARGIGKTFLSAVFCVTRCILYPGTKICIASGTRGQAYIKLGHTHRKVCVKSIELLENPKVGCATT